MEDAYQKWLEDVLDRFTIDTKSYKQASKTQKGLGNQDTAAILALRAKELSIIKKTYEICLKKYKELK